MFVAGTPVVRRQATTRMAIRIRGGRTTGAPTCLLHFTLQPGFATDSLFPAGVPGMWHRRRHPSLRLGHTHKISEAMPSRYRLA